MFRGLFSVRLPSDPRSFVFRVSLFSALICFGLWFRIGHRFDFRFSSVFDLRNFGFVIN